MTTPKMTWEIEKNIDEIGTMLMAYRMFWSGRPFWNDRLLWEDTYPEISKFLRSWTMEELEHFERSPHLHPKAPNLIREIAAQSTSLTKMSILYDTSVSLPTQLSYHIKKRKWSQIEHLLSAMSNNHTGFVDWCCGKGHLGRTLTNHFDVPVHGLEIDSVLIESGKELTATNHHCFTVCDVQQQSNIPKLQGTMVALHSCGELLECAIDQYIEQDMEGGYFVSCCYHRISSEKRQNISAFASKYDLVLDPFELRIPSTFEFSASQKMRKRRRREMEYRIAFDLILRDVTGSNTYQKLLSVPDSWKDDSFENFVQNIAKRESISLSFSFSKNVNLNAYLIKGKEKLRQIRGLASLRSLFSRLIELWIVGDRALYIQEQREKRNQKAKHDVQIGVFAPESVTPRNIVIIA